MVSSRASRRDATSAAFGARLQDSFRVPGSDADQANQLIERAGTGQTGLAPIFQGAADFDLELIESRTLDGHIQELVYRPHLHA